MEEEEEEAKGKEEEGKERSKKEEGKISPASLQILGSPLPTASFVPFCITHRATRPLPHRPLDPVRGCPDP
jgi:hypothetical protein